MGVVASTEPDSTVPPDPPLRLITTPTHPVLGPVTTAEELAEAVRRLQAGTGPVAVDAERASGYRYSQRAYLIQLARVGSGNILIDPIPFNTDSLKTSPTDAEPTDTEPTTTEPTTTGALTAGAARGGDAPGNDVPGALAALQDAIGGVEWVLHAASQDLPGLREIGLEPASVFDTETAGRLLGLERVSLNSMLERFLGVSLEKGHSAADWSQRPLPSEWLVYAALDVDLLVDLRDVVEAELIRAGKLAWAQQEWAATLAAPPAGPRSEPWRRTSGIHAVRSRRQLAGVQALWEARDEIARARDIAPGRILPDAAIIAAVRADPESVDALAHLPVFRGPRQRQHAGRWFAALDEARTRPDAELPATALGSRDGMPASGRWRERDPEAAVRLLAVREAVNVVAEQHHVQAQNLLAADVIRRLCWTPPVPGDPDTVAAALTHLGARPWQVELCAEPISAALATAPAGALAAPSAPLDTPAPARPAVPPDTPAPPRPAVPPAPGGMASPPPPMPPRPDVTEAG